MEIEMFFGDTRGLSEFSIGDRYKWLPGKSVPKGGRPDNGNLDGEGYAECPLCRQDFFVKVIIRDDVINNVAPDLTKKPFIASRLD
jgi:hypothetical protein